jgi:thiamine transporter ThiT
MEWKKGVISGIVAGIVMLIIGSAFMMIPGVTEWYTEKFPDMVATTAMSIMMVGVVLIGMFMGLVYSVINSAIPGEGARKGLNYGIMVWLLAGLMWPIMMMGFAPAYLWIVELINGLITYSIAGAVISIIYEKL